MELLTFAAAAAKAGVSESTIRRKVRDGSLPEHKHGSRPRVTLQDLQRVFPGTPGQAPAETHQGCRVIAFANQKGGVGKTTTCANLAALLAKTAPVLVIDCDAQGNLTGAFGINPDTLKVTTYNVLVDRVAIEKAILTPIDTLPNLQLVGANLELSAADPQLIGAVARDFRLTRALEPVKSRYSYILIDCPPALTTLTINALTAANEVIIPVDVGVFSLRGVAKLMETIAECKLSNPNLDRVRPLANETDISNLAKDVRGAIERAFKGDAFATTIRKHRSIGEAQGQNLPITHLNPKDAASLEYQALADEVKGATRSSLPATEEARG